MRINTKLIPLKLHYFCFLGCVSPIMPFLMVVGTQLGLPVSITGALNACSLMTVVLLKPSVSAMADAFPHHRRFIFLLTLTIMVASLSSIAFIPTMGEPIRVDGVLGMDDRVDVDAAKFNPEMPKVPSVEIRMQKPVLLTKDDGMCYVKIGWTCEAKINLQHSQSLPVENLPPFQSLTTPIPLQNTPLQNSPLKNSPLKNSPLQNSPLPFKRLELIESERDERVEKWDDDKLGVWRRMYKLELDDNNVTHLISSNITVWCGGGERYGVGCGEVWSLWQFWGYAALLLIGTIAYKTAVSITDAIAVDTIGPDGNYGHQRAWGTVGWGLMGPISGLLIDWYSGTSLIKDFTPAFLVCFVVGVMDILIATATIKVPRLKTTTGQLRLVLPILRQPRFLMFCVFVVLSGAFNMLAVSFVFIMQEEMAQGTEYMKYIKLIQGLTLFVQCSTEAPFMAINNWFLKGLGSHHVTSLVFGLYVFRLLGLCVAGVYGPLWTTLLVEMLNGPCYGLGYTAIVVYSFRISPPGVSTTIQSLTNLCYESFGYALGMFGGGILYSWLGGPWMYFVGAMMATLTLILHLLSTIFPLSDQGIQMEQWSSQEKEKLKTETEVRLLPAGDGGGKEQKV